MAWIESHQSLANHPKTFGLACAMQFDLDTAIAKLHRFWWWCLDYAPTGDLRRYNDAQIALGMGVAISESKRLVEAMKQSCWIDSDPYFRVHDWWDYAGRFLQVKWKNYPSKWEAVKKAYSCVDDQALVDFPSSGHKEEGSKNPPKGSSKPINQPNQPNLIPLNPPDGGRERKPRKEFKPPSLEEVQAECLRIELPVEQAEAFVDYFESVGWTIGKSCKPMRSFPGALRTWKRNYDKRKGLEDHATQHQGSGRKFNRNDNANAGRAALYKANT